jgi:hypothetical protein
MGSQQSFEDFKKLHTSEFTQTQIERLTCLRRAYIEKERRHYLLEQRRLEFARWLVLHGRLTDGLPARQHESH